MRWLQSEKVQKVVSSSKMLSRVRKKIQKKDKAIKTVTAEKSDVTQEVAKPSISIIGSIEEYERLFGMKVKKATDDTAPSAVSDSSSTAVQGTSTERAEPVQERPSKKAAPAFGSDDEDEDSEEEALWSKILKKP